MTQFSSSSSTRMCSLVRYTHPYTHVQIHLYYFYYLNFLFPSLTEQYCKSNCTLFENLHFVVYFLSDFLSLCMFEQDRLLYMPLICKLGFHFRQFFVSLVWCSSGGDFCCSLYIFCTLKIFHWMQLCVFVIVWKHSQMYTCTQLVSQGNKGFENISETKFFLTLVKSLWIV